MSHLHDYTPLRAVALHEAAHAVSGETQGLRVRSVSIVPDEGDESLGRVLWERPDELSRAHIAALLAGDLAQLAPGEQGNYLPVYGGERDQEQARDMALELAEREGTGFGGADRYFDAGRQRAADLVSRHRAVIDHVADVLLEQRTLDGAALRRAMLMKPAWYLHDDETAPKPIRARSAPSDYTPLATDWQDDGNGGFVAKRTFTALYDGQVIEIKAGLSHVAEGHALVAGLRAAKPRKRSSQAPLRHLAGVQRAPHR